MLEDCSTTATLVCGGCEFQADRVILSEVSPYFRSAFSNGWVETTIGRVELPTIHPKSMKIILECINTGEVRRIPRSKEGLQQLVEDADYLQFDELVKLVFGLLASRQLSIRNFRELYDLSQKLNNNQYCVSQVLAFLADNFCDLSKCDDFLFLTSHELKMILQQPELHKHGTKPVFTGIMLWAKFDDSRAIMLEDFIATMEEHGWCSACLTTNIKDSISKAWNRIIMEQLQALLAIRNQNMSPSRGFDSKEKLLVFGYTSSNESVMSTFDKTQNRWVGTRVLPFELEDGMSVGAYGCHVFFFGGEKTVNDLQCDDEYDPEQYYEYSEFSESFRSDDDQDVECEYGNQDEEQYYEYYSDDECPEFEDEFYECIELNDGSDGNDDPAVQYYEYNDYEEEQSPFYVISNKQSDERLCPSDGCVTTFHNYKKQESASSNIFHFFLSFFGGYKGNGQNREGGSDASWHFSTNILMSMYNIFKTQWTIAKLISYFLSSFEDRHVMENRCSLEYDYGIVEDYDYSDSECSEHALEETTNDDGNNEEECVMEIDVDGSNECTNDDEYSGEIVEVEETSEEEASSEETGSEASVDLEDTSAQEDAAYGDDEDGEAEEEEYEEYEEYDEGEYDDEYDEYNELLEELEETSVQDDEDVVGVEYCRVYHNNIDEWNRMTVFCPVTNAILQHVESPLIFSVCLAGAGVLDDSIYIVNGVNEHYAMVKHVQCFKPTDYSCKLVACTNKAHCSAHVMPFNKGLYILGSCNRNDKVVEHYDVQCDQWTVLTRLPRSIDLCIATLCQKKLLILRKGFEHQFHTYDLTTGSWLLTDYNGGPAKVEWLSSAELNSKSLLLVYDSSNVMHQYDMDSAKWVTESKQNLNMRNCLFNCSI